MIQAKVIICLLELYYIYGNENLQTLKILLEIGLLDIFKSSFKTIVFNAKTNFLFTEKKVNGLLIL